MQGPYFVSIGSPSSGSRWSSASSKSWKLGPSIVIFTWCLKVSDLLRGHVLRTVSLQQPSLLVALREQEEDERGTEQDGDDAGQVGPLVAVQEGRLRCGDEGGLNIGRVTRGRVGRARKRLGELGLDAARDVLAGRVDRRARGGR